MDMTKIGEALYVINKNAKKIRDERNNLKVYLFDDNTAMGFYEFQYITSEILDKYDISPLPDCPIDLDGINSLEELEALECSNELYCFEYFDEFKEFVLRTVNKDEDEIIELINDFLTDSFYDSPEKSIFKYFDEKTANKILDNEKIFITELIEVNKLKRNVMEWRWQAEDRLTDLHNLLYSLKNEKENLYDLKNEVLETLFTENGKLKSPKDIHRFKNDDYNLYLLYEVGDFTFHYIMDEYEAQEQFSFDISEVRTLEDINSDIVNVAIPLDEAKKILQDFLCENRLIKKVKNKESLLQKDIKGKNISEQIER